MGRWGGGEVGGEKMSVELVCGECTLQLNEYPYTAA